MPEGMNAQKAFVNAASTSRQREGASSNTAANGPVYPASTAQNFPTGGGCPVVQSGSSPAYLNPFEGGSGCPVVGATVNQGNSMPPSPNAPLPGQNKPLGTWRQHSSIPSGQENQKDEAASPRWVYPSEQMFYNAMKRKGWSPAEDDMTAVVAIHNAVNERAWREILRWEAAVGNSSACGGPRLVRFRGRPQEFSPKARLLNVLGYRLPFDRHDWIVDRCGREVRYVIDFYNAAPPGGAPAALHLDVRPALDSPSACWERLSMQWQWVRSGRWTRE